MNLCLLHLRSMAAAGVCLCALAVTPHLRAQTLREAFESMITHEPELLAAGWNSIASEHDVWISKAARKPQLTFNGSAGAVSRTRSLDGVAQGSGDALFSRQVGFTLRLQLFDFGVSRNLVEAAQFREGAQKYLEMAMIEAQSVDLADIYLQILRAKEQINLAQSNVDQHEATADKLEAATQGRSGESDLLLVKGRIGMAKVSLQTQQLLLEKANYRFERLTGLQPLKLKAPDRAPIPSSLEELNVSQNWEYLAAKEAWEASGAEVKAARRSRLPKAFADLGYSRGEDVLGIEGADNETSALLKVEWNLIDGGAGKHQHQRAVALQNKTEQLMRAADMERLYLGRNLWSEMEDAKVRMSALKRYADRLEETRANYEEQHFQRGERDLIAILDLDSETYQAQSNLIDTRYTIHSSTYRILGVQGQFVNWLRGELSKNPVTEVVDPDARE
ncbi:MAG: TolC family protein [Verrucomicrobiota bacterium]